MTQNNWIEKTCKLVTSIIDSEGNIVAETEDPASMPNFSRHEFKQLLKVVEPQLWTPENPNMYHIHSKLFIDETLVDDMLTPLGIRTISFDSTNGFSLNDETVKLKGVCLHQDSGIYGGAVPVQEWVRKLLKLKTAGCNAIRTSHHPFPTEFYHVCDYLGFMVMDEAFDEWQMGWDRGLVDGPYGKYIYGYYLHFEQWHETDLRAMLRRDRNHPSVIMWSIGNEIPELYFDEGIDIVKKLVSICKEEDTTRPVTVCAEGNHLLRIREGIMDQVDVAGYNYVSSREGKAMYSRFHEEHPEWVLLGSETEFEPGHWKTIMDNPYVIGQFLWSGYDYLGEGADIFGEDANLGNTFDISVLAAEKRGSDKRVIRHGWAFGVLDIVGTPKGEYYYRKSVWNDEPAVYLAVKSDLSDKKPYQYFLSHLHWNWNTGDMKTIYCFTNCEKVELYLNDELIGIREVERNYPFALEWDIEYAPGTLKAIGYNNNIKVCENELDTAGKPARIMLECDTDILSVDAVDYANITISIVDENGTLVPNASNRLTARITGCGSLFGIFSADMTSNESYRAESCHAFRGKCMAVVKSSQETGTIEVVVEGEGLQPGVLHLRNV
jgi:beta-galactosidase